MNNTGLVDCGLSFLSNTVMTGHQVILVQQSWKLFRNIRPEVIGDVFYSKLFTKMPALKKMFKGPMTDQYKKLIDMLSVIVSRLNNWDTVTPEIQQMAKRHAGYGVKAAHYKIVGDCLLWTLEQGLGADWNKELKEAWANCYKILAATMIAASGY